MTLDEYQQLATRTINTKLSSDERLLDASAGLAEEAGEILGLVRKHVFQAKSLNEQDLEKELGDALWCLAIAANTAGLSLDRVATTNVAKLRKRYPNGYRDVR